MIVSETQEGRLCVDWNKIKSEYITDDTASYTKLAKKYGIARSTIANRAGQEGWVAEKERYRNELVTKTVAAVQKKQVDKMKRIQDLTDKLLDKLEQAMDELDRQLVRDVTKVKEIEYNNDLRPDKPTKEIIKEHETVSDVSTIIDRTGLKAIASALRDIKEVQMLKTELDRQEQEARIAKLQKESKDSYQDDGKPKGIILLPIVGDELMPPSEEDDND